MLVQECVSRPLGADWEFKRRGLKDGSTGQYEKTDVCKQILVGTQNEVMNLKNAL